MTLRRAALKSLSWRTVATSVTAGIVYAKTGSVSVAVAIGGADCVLKLVLYYAHELVWEKIP